MCVYTECGGLKDLGSLGLDTVRSHGEDRSSKEKGMGGSLAGVL